MKKFVSLIIGALMFLSTQAYAPMILNQNSHVNQKYENFRFANNQKMIEERIRPISSDLAYEKIMSSPFVNDYYVNKEVFEIAERLLIDPINLLIVMYKESSLDLNAVNDYSQAYGLIQWLPSTARSLNTTVEDLKKMSILEQLDKVEEYLIATNKIDKVTSLVDLYLCIFHPKAVGKGENYIICKKGSVRYYWNRFVDMNKDGILTSKDVETFGMKKLV